MKRNSALIKAGVVLVLVLLLLIPAAFIQSLVRERENIQQQAIHEVSSKWGEKQTLTGPVITIPYVEYYRDTAKNLHKETKYIHFLPQQLSINGQIFPEKRYRSIYEIVVYNSKLNFSGNFSDINPKALNIPKENILYDKAFISLGITDLRGIEEQVTLKWNDSKLNFNPGIETNDVSESGISAQVKLNPTDTAANSRYDFSFDLTLKGSELLYFVPVGKVTDVNITSNWPNPGFDGAFLPDSREISKTGFKANWKILNLNRNYPQSWVGSKSIEESSFGINLLLPVDGYTKTNRSVKYALLFIGLTFMIFYFLEILNNKQIHPLQYILIGFALCIFFTLLLSFSEYVGFNLAYFIAAVMTIVLITLYTLSILKDKKLAMLIGATLTLLYGFIFTIIQLQDYSLLMGSLGLFITLAAVMYFSRKIDWQNTGLRRE
jgi:inner membrane protein